MAELLYAHWRCCRYSDRFALCSDLNLCWHKPLCRTGEELAADVRQSYSRVLRTSLYHFVPGSNAFTKHKHSRLCSSGSRRYQYFSRSEGMLANSSAAPRRDGPGTLDMAFLASIAYGYTLDLCRHWLFL